MSPILYITKPFGLGLPARILWLAQLINEGGKRCTTQRGHLPFDKTTTPSQASNDRAQREERYE